MRPPSLDGNAVSGEPRDIACASANNRLKALRRLFGLAGPCTPKSSPRDETDRTPLAAKESGCLALPPLPHDESLGAGFGLCGVGREATEGAFAAPAWGVRIEEFGQRVVFYLWFCCFHAEMRTSAWQARAEGQWQRRRLPVSSGSCAKTALLLASQERKSLRARRRPKRSTLNGLATTDFELPPNPRPM